MTSIDLVRFAVKAALTCVLVLAAANDIQARKIPNKFVLAVLVLFVVWSAFGFGPGLGASLEAGLLALLVTVLLYAFGILGAGDAKLFSVVALFAGLQDIGALAISTALIGGVMAVVSLARDPRKLMAMITLRRMDSPGRGIPYGVAIAFGGAFVLWESSLIGPYLHGKMIFGLH